MNTPKGEHTPSRREEIAKARAELQRQERRRQWIAGISAFFAAMAIIAAVFLIANAIHALAGSHQETVPAPPK